MWVLEVVMISFKIAYRRHKKTQITMYHYIIAACYYMQDLLSSFAKGKLKRVGDVFLATGGIIGGIVFMILPTTSLPAYPMLHIVSLHSFLYHGTMVYLGHTNKCNTLYRITLHQTYDTMQH